MHADMPFALENEDLVPRSASARAALTDHAGADHHAIISFHAIDSMACAAPIGAGLQVGGQRALRLVVTQASGAGTNTIAVGTTAGTFRNRDRR